MMKDYSKLLIDVQKKSNIQVTSARDIKFLKEEIEYETHKKIAYNTLRRLFGFLEKTTPSLATLDTLSLYLNFRSYSNYKNSQNNYDGWYFQQNLQRILHNKKLKNDDINEINEGISNPENIVYLAYFLSHYITNNQVQLLQTIFEKCDFTAVSGTELHKFSTIISSTLSLLPEKKSLQFYQVLVQFDSFRNNVPLLYIDYARLKSRYLKILCVVENQRSNNSDLLFVSLMRFYNHFYTEEKERVSHHKLYKSNDFDDFHSVLKGRYYGCELLKSEKIDSKITSEIKEECRNAEISSFFEEIIPALIIKNYYPFLDEIFKLYYEEIFESSQWSSSTTNAIYLIGLSNVNWQKGNIKTAKLNLELIDLKKIELSYQSYVTLFYYLTKMKISHHEGLKKENQLEYSFLKAEVKKTGFTLFMTAAEKFIVKNKRKKTQFNLSN